MDLVLLVEEPYLKLIKKNTTGFTLVEVLVAVVIVGLVLTAIAAAISFSVKNSSQADYRQVATRYAQDAIDIIRQKRATDGWSAFTSFMTTGNDYCVAENAVKKSSNCSSADYKLTNNEAEFTRKIDVVNSTTDIQLTVTVEWQDGSEWRDVEVVQKLFDY